MGGGFGWVPSWLVELSYSVIVMLKQGMGFFSGEAGLILFGMGKHCLSWFSSNRASGIYIYSPERSSVFCL